MPDAVMKQVFRDAETPEKEIRTETAITAITASSLTVETGTVIRQRIIRTVMATADRMIQIGEERADTAITVKISLPSPATEPEIRHRITRLRTLRHRKARLLQQPLLRPKTMQPLTADL